jgi:hypothetical protein
VSPCRPSPRRCGPPPEPSPKLWCLTPKMAYKPLIIRPFKTELRKLGLRSHVFDPRQQQRTPNEANPSKAG